jgi:hypothetical protein
MKIFDLRDLDELRVSNDRWLTLYIVICFAFHLIIFKLPIPYLRHHPQSFVAMLSSSCPIRSRYF